MKFKFRVDFQIATLRVKYFNDYSDTYFNVYVIYKA